MNEDKEETLRDQINSLEEGQINEELHKLIMAKVRELGVAGHEALVGLIMGSQPGNNQITSLHFLPQFTSKEAIRILKQALLK